MKLPRADTPITEKLDYFSAALSILYSLFITVVRLLHIYTPVTLSYRQSGILASSPRPSPSRKHLFRAWAFFCIMLYVGHVSYLSFSPRFDYGYNVLANVIVGLTHNALWIFFSIPYTPFRRFPFPSSPAVSHAQLDPLKRNASALSSQRHHRKAVRRDWVPAPAYIALLTTLASALEIFDFPPWRRIIDAHSLWHLATTPIAVLWYRFLVQDSRDDGWIAQKV
jgi:post-GPI attachment to proteins factor 3